MTTKQAFIKIATAIRNIYDIGECASIAGIVMEDAFGIKPHLLNDEKHLPETQQKELNKIIKRLLTHEPVQYVLGKTIFYGLPFKVDKNVLIPRQETEELVAWAIASLQSKVRSPQSVPGRILDIGTGSGCIPVSIKYKLPDIEVHALDVSKGALNVAKENAAMNNTAIIFHEVDILNEKAWPTLPKYDLIVSNPPYITEDEKDILPENVIDYEPHLALFSGGNDAQRFVKKITKFAQQKLNKGGSLFFETNEFYAPDSKKTMEKHGFVNVELRKDLNGRDRMLRGEKV